MERPDEFQGRETLTAEEVSEIRATTEARNEELLLADAQRTQAGGNIGAYNNFWMERGARSNRTSMLVDPPDGQRHLRHAQCLALVGAVKNDVCHPRTPERLGRLLPQHPSHPLFRR